MLRSLNDLATLDFVLHISAGPVAPCRSTVLTFTHLLHSRYRSKSGLASYINDLVHVSVVTDYAKPIVDEVMAVYWVADDFTGVVVVPPGASLRLTVVKLGEEVVGKGKILGIVRGMNGKFDSIEQLTVGENFSPGMSKGFSIASIAIINCVGCELD
ncbi:stress-response A/B barrel domain-containing protein UP3-like [Salvia splendens]|uniref:stress-response A/B barrel domain-containing protein UP3-like n=1 Tax=Salvia splendens TaxID=180675 RepID=UPI0011001972|nr:stress-response A/B barrel domain-containing protein UP3-like [Salvia splendens]